MRACVCVCGDWKKKRRRRGSNQAAALAQRKGENRNPFQMREREREKQSVKNCFLPPLSYGKVNHCAPLFWIAFGACVSVSFFFPSPNLVVAAGTLKDVQRGKLGEDGERRRKCLHFWHK